MQEQVNNQYQQEPESDSDENAIRSDDPSAIENYEPLVEDDWDEEEAILRTWSCWIDNSYEFAMEEVTALFNKTEDEIRQILIRNGRI